MPFEKMGEMGQSLENASEELKKGFEKCQKINSSITWPEYLSIRKDILNGMKKSAEGLNIEQKVMNYAGDELDQDSNNYPR